MNCLNYWCKSKLSKVIIVDKLTSLLIRRRKSTNAMPTGYLSKILLLTVLLILSVPGESQSLIQQRQDFLRAESLLNKADDQAFFEFSESLKDYPLLPYLQYQWLKNHLSESDKIVTFLAQHKNTHYAELLRSKWLDYLIKQERWHEFIRQYQVSDNVEQKCMFYWALYQTGNKQQALLESKRLWVSSDAQQPACESLFTALSLSSELTPDLIWQRFELALNKDRLSQAEKISQLLTEPVAHKTADLWLKVHKKPSLIKDSSLWVSGDKLTGRIFADGITQLAKTDLDLAIHIWDGRKNYLNIKQEVRQAVEQQLALALAYQQDNRAYQRLSQLTVNIDKTKEWRVRAALFEQNWTHVAAALAGLSTEELQQPSWQYWLGRALAANGKWEQSQAVYTKLAQDRSFYGFLAADSINQPYQFTDKPVLVEKNQLAALAEETDFKVIQEFNSLNRDLEARRQWWFATQKLSKERLLIAAKLAQQWQWDQFAIITLVKADYWDDLALRFPVRYFNQVKTESEHQQLDPSIIFGLMRQESMLDPYALSPVGARGLLQMMPETARYVADQLNETWSSDVNLHNPDLNIRYGSHYFKHLLNHFNGHFALATAAYNAGPHRVEKWLPAVKAIPADIWIETIPFKETRKYVTSVLSYAIIYQHRLENHTLKIKKLLPDVLAH